MKRKENHHNNEILGFTTNRGLMLDLDNTTLKETREIAKDYVKRFRLEGYLILKSSQNNYHIVFNRFLSWRKVCSYLGKIVWWFHYHKHGIKPKLTNWAWLQIIKCSETLRISNKIRKKPPKIIEIKGKSDKLIREYLGFYQEFSANKEQLIKLFL